MLDAKRGGGADTPPPGPADDLTTLASGASLALMGKVAGRGLDLVTDIVIARVLGPGSFGLYAIGSTLLRMLGLITPMGMDKGVIRYGSAIWQTDKTRLRNIIVQSFWIAFAVGFAIGAGLFFLAPWLATVVFRKPELEIILRGFSFAFPLTSGFSVALAATRISQRMKYTVLAQDLLQPIAGLLLILGFFLLGFRIIGVLAAEVLSLASALLITLWFLRRLFPEVYSRSIRFRPAVRELLTFSIPAVLAGVFTTFIVWVDRLIVGYFCPPSEVGVYQAVSQTSTVFAIVLTGFGTVFTPMIASMYHRKEHARLEELFRISTKWGLYISLPIFLMICFYSREILDLLFDSRYAVGWLPFFILALGQFVNVGTGAVGPILVMTGRQKLWLLLSAVFFAANVAMNIAFIPAWGIVGAAVSTSLTLAGLFLTGVVVIRRTLRMWPYDRRYWKGIISALITAGALFGIRYADPAMNVIGLLLLSLACATTFFCMLLVQGLEKEDWEFLRLIASRLRRQLMDTR